MSSSNSNSVNIGDLPPTQFLINGDLLIVQTADGTQVIDFANVNFVKTDINGNSLLSGNLSGANLFFVSGIYTSLSAANFSSNGLPGILLPTGYYNTFTLTNGLVTSASYVQGSPEYVNLTQTFIPAVTAYQTTVYSTLTTGLIQFADQNGQAAIYLNTSNTQVSINNFFNNYPISVNNITPAHFTVVPANDIGTIPYVSNIQNQNQNLTFQLNLGGTTSSGVILFWRLLVSY
jgi:hypothetical protein